MGIATLAFASCAKDTVTETNNGQAIDFRVATQTRALETTTGSLENFYVTAVYAEYAEGAEGSEGNWIPESVYFEKVQFVKELGYFVSTPAYYWPNEGQLNFYAYAPAMEGLAFTHETQTLTGFAPADDIADQVDFIVATASGSKANEANGVELTFDHMLSQIEIKAKNTNEAFDYEVAGVRIAGVLGKADFDFATTNWSFANYTDVKKTYTVELTEPVELDNVGVNVMDKVSVDVDEFSDNAMLLPQDLSANGMTATFGVYVKVTSKSTRSQVFPSTGDYGWMDVAVTTNWEAGYKYVYTLDMSQADELGTPIKFTLEEVTPMGAGATE